MKKASFSDVLDVVENLSLDAREELIEILHKRATEERRAELAKDVRNARIENRRGKSKAMSAKAIMDEIVS